MQAINHLLTRLADALLSAYMAVKFRPGQSLDSAQAEYRAELALVMLEYYESARPVTAFRNQYKRATNDAFNIAFVAGWADGGASGPILPELQAWINGEIDRQMGYIDGVFDELKALRKEGDRAAADAFIGARADGYSSSLVGVYAYAKMQAAKLKMGVWKVGPTEHCTTCAGLNDQVRTVRWFLESGYIPQQNGNPNLECGGWNCQCEIQDPATGERLIP